MDELDRVVDQVLAQVVAVLGERGRVDAVVVVGQVGAVLVGLALHEPVEPVEPPLQRPLVVGTGGRRVGHLAEVPLADRERREPLLAQDLGDRARVVRDVTGHVGIAGVEVRDAAHADAVVVATGQQRGAGGGAERGDVEIRVLEAPGGEPIDVRRVDLGAVAAEMRESGVVKEDDDDVRRVLTGVRTVREPRGRLLVGVADRAAVLAELLHRSTSHRDKLLAQSMPKASR